MAWSSGQRRSLSLQGSRDRIPVFLSFDRVRFFVYSFNSFHVVNDLSTQCDGSVERHARRDEEEGPAGVSGMATTKDELVRFEDD